MQIATRLSQSNPSTDIAELPSFGFVVIGRNEGERLRRCLQSLPAGLGPVVYVDSGSVDNSQAMAASLGATVVSLDTTTKFTAARARNTGFRKLKEIVPDIEFVQFVDGDCEVAPGWPVLASQWLSENKDYAVASGRRHEKFRDASIYHHICEIEWQTPIGDVLACGGDAMFRVAPFEAIGGYRESLIAGEEPELCFRLRREGWKVRKLDAEMGLHDASMTRFSQWWKRSRRSGYAYAEGAFLHGHSPEGYCVRNCAGILFWGGMLPVAIVLGLIFVGPVAAWALLAYPAQVVKVRITQRGARRSWRWAAFMMIAKFAELLGLLDFVFVRIRRGNRLLIEYK